MSCSLEMKHIFKLYLLPCNRDDDHPPAAAAAAAAAAAPPPPSPASGEFIDIDLDGKLESPLKEEYDGRGIFRPPLSISRTPPPPLFIQRATKSMRTASMWMLDHMLRIQYIKNIGSGLISESAAALLIPAVKSTSISFSSRRRRERGDGLKEDSEALNNGLVH